SSECDHRAAPSRQGEKHRRRFAPADLTGHAPGGQPQRQNWGKFAAHKWGGFNARSQVRELVLDDAAPFVPLVMKKRGKEIDYAAKTVMLAGRRYIVCRNHQEAEKDAADRASIVAALERQLAKGDKALVSNTGFRRYLKTISQEHFAIDPDKIAEEK